MAAQICAPQMKMNLDSCEERKSASVCRAPIDRIASRISVSGARMNMDLKKDMTPSSVFRRTSNPHPNLWSFDFIHSLKSPYGESCYRERAETLISDIKGMFDAMGDGEISPSAYDTAWVAKVAAVDDKFCPRFPRALEWILQNQLKDGSWGSSFYLLPSDRLLPTLSCILTLTKWNTGDHQVGQALEFMRNNLQLMNDESQHSLVADAELIFPSLLNEAKLQDLSLPYDLYCVHQLFRKREERIKLISAESFHSVPSSLLCCLEGLQDIIDWERILNVQSEDGSFLSSPAATACAYMHTGDQKCLAFLENMLTKLGGWAPCLYPVDLLERLLAVDTVERLGIDRLFEREIKGALDYVYRYWDDERGIAYGRQSLLPDLETTALAFRLLRLHRYKVSSAVFQNFKDQSGLFRSSGDQILHSEELESMLNLHRASQIAFPGEDIMDEAKTFTTAYLRNALTKGEAFGMWNDKQHLGQEIKCALENPWQSSLPRLEAKRYCEGYRPDRARLGKSVYRLPLVYNAKYLELAKLDFNILQSVHQQEMKDVTRWFTDSGLPQFTFSRQRPIEYYFTVCMGTFEPEFCKCRLEFAKIACLETVLDDIYDTYGTLDELILFTKAVKRWDLSMIDSLPEYMKVCFKIWYDIVHEVAWEAEKEQGRELLGFFREVWEDYIGGYLEEAEWLAAQHVPTLDMYIKTGIRTIGLRILVLSGIFLLGQFLPDNILGQIDYPSKFIELVCLTSRLSDDAQTFQAEKARGELVSSIECYMKDNGGSTKDDALNHLHGLIDSAMKEMVREFLKPDDVPFRCKKYVFDIARAFLLAYKDGDGYGISNKEIKDYITECLINPMSI